MLSMVVCELCFAEPDTILVFKIFYGVFGEGTRLCNADDNLRARLIILKAWFGVY